MSRTFRYPAQAELKLHQYADQVSILEYTDQNTFVQSYGPYASHSEAFRAAEVLRDSPLFSELYTYVSIVPSAV